MSKKYIDWATVESYTSEITRQISLSRWQPDYVVGLTRGGLIPATLLSHWLECPMHTLLVRLRDGQATDCESNCWMAEDALGYNQEPKNILIVDDINDTGATINWIINDWRSLCSPDDERWSNVWNNNVRVATLYDKLSSVCSIKVDYTAVEMASDDDTWLVFPWEEWWHNKRV